MKPGWLTDEGWQEAFREAVRSGEVIMHECRIEVRKDVTRLVLDISYKDDSRFHNKIRWR